VCVCGGRGGGRKMGMAEGRHSPLKSGVGGKGEKALLTNST